MPDMADPRFQKTVIFLCSHDEDGAMGLVVNRAHEDISFPQLCDKIELECLPENTTLLLAGGPVEIGRGFVLHQPDKAFENALTITNDIALCATVDVLKAIGLETGPGVARVALGYAGWGEGQLEQEILENAWLICDADQKLVLDTRPQDIYTAALAKLGIELSALVSTAGRA
ncbi:MAG: YqgE/AlgH family protein [Rhizobiales bacterium]|nr:YqgE/AlgH family protein [Hyphomicrobiales bacterium]